MPGPPGVVLTQYQQSGISRGTGRFMARAGYRLVFNASVPGFVDDFTDTVEVTGFNSFVWISTITGAGAFDILIYSADPNDPSNGHQRDTIHHAVAGSILLPMGGFSTGPSASDVCFFFFCEYLNSSAAARSFTLRLFGTKR